MHSKTVVVEAANAPEALERAEARARASKWSHLLFNLEYISRVPLDAPHQECETDGCDDGPEYGDGCSKEGFEGGCERMGCCEYSPKIDIENGDDGPEEIEMRIGKSANIPFTINNEDIGLNLELIGRLQKNIGICGNLYADILISENKPYANIGDLTEYSFEPEEIKEIGYFFLGLANTMETLGKYDECPKSTD